MVAWLLAASAMAHIPDIWVTGPDDDWCAVANSVQAGDIIMLVAGDYYGPCDIVGLPPMDAEITIIESLDPQDPAILHNGGGDYILSLTGSTSAIMLMEFRDVPAGTSAIELRAGNDLSIRFNEFHDLEGDAVVTAGSVIGGQVNDNTFTGIGGTAFQFGCDDGNCVFVDVDVHENLVEGAGSGFLFGPGSWGVLEDNTIAGVADVGVSIAGGTETSVLEQNFVEAGADAMIIGGSAWVDNNIAVAARSLHVVGAPDQWVRGNTLGGTVTLDAWGSETEQHFVNNAVVGTVPAPGGTATVGGNVDCSNPASCFYDAGSWDFYPLPDAALRTDGEEIGESLLSDWCGRGRSLPPTVGALEAASVLSFGSVELIQKDDFYCILPDDPPLDTDPPTTDTDTTPDQPGFDDDGGKKKRKQASGCGCQSGGSGAPWLAVLLAAVVARRRWLFAALLLPGTASAHVGQIFTIGPEEDWCNFINNDVLPGDLIFFLPGVYEGPCDWVALEPSEMGETNMLQSADLENPAIFTAPEGSDYVLAVSGIRVGILHLWFQDLGPETAAILVESAQTVQVRHSHFVDVQGDGVQITSANDVWVADTEFINVGRTAVRVGCPAEGDCTASDVLVSNLLVDGADVGVVVHSGSEANILDGVYGPGANHAFTYSGEPGLIAGNLTWSPVAIFGEANMENNIFAAGLHLETSATGTSLRGNTIIGGIASAQVPDTYTFVGNAVEGTTLDGADNISCSDPAACWEDVDGGDFRPSVGSELLTEGIESGLVTDFCGDERSVPGVAGALERSEAPAPLALAFKQLQLCSIPDFEVTKPDDDTKKKKRKVATGCGCATGRPAPGVLWGLVLVVLLARSRME